MFFQGLDQVFIWVLSSIKVFVAHIDGEVVGCIVWSEKSGFRKEAVLEAEPVAIIPGLYSGDEVLMLELLK